MCERVNRKRKHVKIDTQEEEPFFRLANEFRVRLLVLLKGRFMRSKMIMLKICKFSINLHRMHAYWM